MPPAGFETAIPAGKRLQTHALDLSATGIGKSRDPRSVNYLLKINMKTKAYTVICHEICSDKTMMMCGLAHTALLWRWRTYVLPQQWQLSAKLHRVTTQEKQSSLSPTWEHQILHCAMLKDIGLWGRQVRKDTKAQKHLYKSYKPTARLWQQHNSLVRRILGVGQDGKAMAEHTARPLDKPLRHITNTQIWRMMQRWPNSHAKTEKRRSGMYVQRV